MDIPYKPAKPGQGNKDVIQKSPWGQQPVMPQMQPQYPPMPQFMSEMLSPGWDEEAPGDYLLPLSQYVEGMEG